MLCNNSVCRDCFDVGEDNGNTTEKKIPSQSSPEGEDPERSESLIQQVISDHKRFLSGPLRENMPPSRKVTGDGDR